MPIRKVNLKKLQNVVYEVKNGKIFTAIFIKKDGSERKMICRRGVVKYLKGGELSFNPDVKGLLTVFDMQKGRYRMINLVTLKEVHTDGTVYTLTV